MNQHPQPKPQHHGRRRSAVATALFNINALIRTAILMGLVFGASQSAWAQGQPIVFSAVGDVPYSTGEISEFQEHMDNLDLYSGSEFLVHLGDIKAGGGNCAESWYQSMAASLRTLSIPAFIVPGDNEWNDCSNPTQAWGLWVKHLMAIEQSFCGLPVVERQSVRPENFAFVKKRRAVHRYQQSRGWTGQRRDTDAPATGCRLDFAAGQTKGSLRSSHGDLRSSQALRQPPGE